MKRDTYIMVSDSEKSAVKDVIESEYGDETAVPLGAMVGRLARDAQARADDRVIGEVDE